jgi:hypothetical protein
MSKRRNRLVSIERFARHSNAQPSPTSAARLELLNETLKHAIAHSEFYRKRYGARAQRLSSLADLASLPFLQKDDIRDHLPQLLTAQQMPDFVQFTGGTLRSPTPLYRSWPEVDAWSERSELLQTVFPKRLKKLCLQLPVPLNGSELPVKGPRSFLVPFVLERDRERIDQLLLKSFDFDGYEKRISIVMSSLPRLKLLTLSLLESDTNWSQYAVRTVVTSGCYLSSRWRQLLTQAWNASVYHYYGLSEVPGSPALECGSCSGYHFDPMVVPEVVSLDTLQPISSGIGVLVLTALHPFVQLQPTIRYWTNDIVELVHCPDSDEPSVKFRGRVQQTIIHRFESGSRYLLFPTDVAEVLDSLPDAAIYPEPLSVGTHASEVGYSKWRASLSPGHGDATVYLEVELRYPPIVFPDRIPVIRERIETSIAQRNPDFAVLRESGKARIEIGFVGPNSLPAVIV